MSEEPSPSTPRLVRVARILGYLAAALGTANLAWVALGHLAVPAPVYTALMIFMAIAAVLVGIFAFLVQADHRRGKAQAEIRADQRKILAKLVDFEQRHRELAAGQALLRNWVQGSSKRTEGWLRDITEGVMKMSGAGEERMVMASAHWTSVQRQIGQLPGVLQEVMVEVVGPVLEALERERQARVEAIADLTARLKQLEEDTAAAIADTLHGQDGGGRPGNVAPFPLRPRQH